MKLLLAHGSSDATHAREVERLAARVSKLLGEAVGTAFLSDQRLPECSELLPLFLGTGKHVREDIPELVKHSHCRLLPSLGEQNDAIAALVGSVQEKNPLFVIYQQEGFERLTSALRPYGSVAFLHGEPSVTSMLNRLHAEGVEELTVQPLLLFPGKSLARVQHMIDTSAMTHIQLGSVLCELDGFAKLVANCFREQG